jgi:hypothetical protein
LVLGRQVSDRCFHLQLPNVSTRFPDGPAVGTSGSPTYEVVLLTAASYSA